MKSSILLLCLLAALLSGCTLFEEEITIHVSPPDSETIPLAAYATLTGWEVITATEGSVSAQRFHPPGAFSLSVPKEKTSVVTLYPVMEPGGILAFPAGVVIRPGWSESRIRATWRGGWVASLLTLLIRQGMNPDVFNSLRLMEELEHRDLDDPWLLSLEPLARDFSAREFTLNSLKIRETQTHTLSGLPPGFILPENPFRDPILIPLSGEVTLSDCPGNHRWYCTGSGSWLSVQIFEKGPPQWELIP